MNATRVLAPRDLTIPEDGSTTAHRVLSSALRRLLGDLRRVPLGRVSALARADFNAFARVVATLARDRPGALVSLVRRPTVGVLIRCIRGVDRNGLHPDRLLRELTATACCELAAMDALPGPIKLHALPPRVVSIVARRVLDVPTPASDVKSALIRNGLVRFETRRGGVTASLRPETAAEGGDAACFTPIAGTPGAELVLALADNNPLSDFEAHPEKQGNTLDLGGRSTRAWTAALAEALERVGTYMPTLRDEIGLVVQQVIPVGYDAHKHLSASYQEDIGTIYMTLHPWQMTMTEALIHEFSHNKINALFELDPVLHNAFHPLFSSPVRPDPRPLHGVLLAVHAFLPVARLYERMIEAAAPDTDKPCFRRRFAQVVAGNHEGAAVLLEHARPTEVGAAVLDEIRRWDEHFARYRTSSTSV